MTKDPRHPAHFDPVVVDGPVVPRQSWDSLTDPTFYVTCESCKVTLYIGVDRTDAFDAADDHRRDAHAMVMSHTCTCGAVLLSRQTAMCDDCFQAEFIDFLNNADEGDR